jgi:hypothetical protein
MKKNEIYDHLTQPKGLAYRAEKLDLDRTHYKDPIDTSQGRLAGKSHIWGDASPEVQSRAIDALIEASQRAGLSIRDTAHVLAIARVESGFNPDAAANTSAYGLGQFLDETGKSLGVTPENRGDMAKQAETLVQYFKDNADKAQQRGLGEDYIYKYHHDGPDSKAGSPGLKMAREDVLPFIPKFEKFVAEYEKKYGILPVDPGFAARNRLAGSHTHEQHDHPVGAPLAQGSHARPASDQAQASRYPARLDDASHPDNALFRQVQRHVYALDQQQGHTPDQSSDNLASALAAEARAQGLQRIDLVTLSDDASSAWAIQKPPGVSDTRYANLRTTDARNTPMERSGARWLEATQQTEPAPRQVLQQAPTISR